MHHHFGRFLLDQLRRSRDTAKGTDTVMAELEKAGARTAGQFVIEDDAVFHGRVRLPVRSEWIIPASAAGGPPT